MSLIERRTAGEVRSQGRTLTGYALVYGAEARVGGGVETIAPGAVTASLASNADILALVDHDPAKVIGRTRSGSLKLAEDARGLAFTIDLPDTTAARDVLALVERGDAGGMSFGFNVPKGGDDWQGTRRTLKMIDLREISVVSSFPAYAATTVEARMKSFADLDHLRLRLAVYQ